MPAICVNGPLHEVCFQPETDAYAYEYADWKHIYRQTKYIVYGVLYTYRAWVCECAFCKASAEDALMMLAAEPVEFSLDDC